MRLEQGTPLYYNGGKERRYDFRLIVGGSRIYISDNGVTGKMALHLDKYSVIENCFDIQRNIPALIRGETIVSLSGREYDMDSFCRLIITAVCLKHPGYTLEELETLADKHRIDYGRMVYILENFYYRLVSNGIRFGCGYRIVVNGKQFYAFYGYPDRNDDIFGYTEITEKEFGDIQKTYPEDYEFIRGDETVFNRRYIENHKGICGGRSVMIDVVSEQF